MWKKFSPFHKPPPIQPKEARMELIESVASANPRRVKAAIQRAKEIDFDLNFIFGRGKRSLLHLASRPGYTEIVKLLLEAGVSTEVKDTTGSTALYWAAQNGHIDVLQLLLDAGANIEASNDRGLRPVHRCCLNGRDKCLERLLTAGADFNVPSGEEKATPTHIACQNGHSNCLRVLVKVGADPRCLDKLRETPAHRAARDGVRCFQVMFGEEVRLLNEEDALVKNGEGESVVQVAVGWGNTAGLKLLLKHLLVKNEVAHAITTELWRCFPNEPIEIEEEEGVGGSSTHEGVRRRVSWPEFVHLCEILFAEEPMAVVLEKQLIETMVDIGCKILDMEKVDDKEKAPVIEPWRQVAACAALLNKVLPPQRTLSPKWTLLCAALENALEKEHGNPRAVATVCGALYRWSHVMHDVSTNSASDMHHSAKEDVAQVVAVAHDAASVQQVQPFGWECDDTVPYGAFAALMMRHQDQLQKIGTADPLLLVDPTALGFVLEDRRYSPLFLDAIRGLDISRKRHWLQQQLEHTAARTSMTGEEEDNPFVTSLSVDRGDVFGGSCSWVLSRASEALRGGLRVSFKGEEGVGPGVVREWFQVVCQQMFDPDYGLFVPTHDGASEYQPAPYSDVNPDHLAHLHFSGRIIGLALATGHQIDVSFVRTVWMFFLGQPICFQDVQVVDAGFYRNLEWILNHDVDVLDLTFTVDDEGFGAAKTSELVSGGASMAVTEDNKREYVDLVARHKMTASILPQLKALALGLYDVIPRNWLRIFACEELELMLCGLPHIDVGDWKEHTEYSGGYSDKSAPVLWFWEYVQNCDLEGRTRVLAFMTGSTRVPPGGFVRLQGAGGAPQLCVITQVPGSCERLPQASTCFNCLKLPCYQSLEQLSKKMDVATKFGGAGFAFR